MTAWQITAPVELAVPLELARAELRIDHFALDPSIEACVRGITAFAQHYMHRAIITQTWRATYDSFTASLALPMRPIQSIVSVGYLDSAGVLQTLAPISYNPALIATRGILLPAYGASWPSANPQAGSITIDYVCGFGDSADNVPDEIRLYILRKLGEQFDPAMATQRDLTHATVQASFLDHLLDSMIVYD